MSHCHVCRPNTKVEDSKSKRPDAVVFSLLQNQYETAVCYGEAKLEEAKKAPNTLVQDLLRLALFSKDTIDNKRLSACMSFQAVGKLFLQPQKVREIY